MARKTKEEAMETRGRILDAAIEVFHSKGVSLSSLEDIAESAGVTRGAIYWHFKNKADIFSALHDEMHEPIMANLKKAQEDEAENPISNLKEFCIDHLNDLATDEKKRKSASLFFLKCDYSGELSALIDEQNKKKHTGINATKLIFQRAKDKGLIPTDSDPDFLALSFICYICGIYMEYLRHPELFNIKSQARPLVEQFFIAL